MKKSLSVLLTLAMIITTISVPFTASAAATETVYYYNDFTTNYDGLTPMTGANIKVEDGCFVQTIVTESNVNVSQGFKFEKTYSNASEDRQPLVLEYRVKFNPTSEYHQFAAHNSGNTHAAYLRAVYKYMQFSRADAEKYYFAEDVNLRDTWHTVSIVYSNTQNTRDFYFDGEYVATSKDTTETKANHWDDAGKFNGIRFDLNDRNGSELYLDYLKLYELPTEDFTAGIKVAYDSAVVVEFNQIPGNISENMFTLNDETAITEVVKVSENIYKLIPEAELTADETYTLGISNELKSSVGKEIATASLEFTPESSVYVDEGELPYFNTFFTGSELGSEFTKTTATSETAYVAVEDDALKIYGKGTTSAGATAHTYFTPTYSNTSENKKPLVLEYKIKFDSASTKSYFAHHGGSTTTTTHGIVVYPKKASGQVSFNSSSSKTYTIDNTSEWHTVSLVYSNTDNTKRLYIDGKYIDTSVPGTNAGENYWDDMGKLGTVRFYTTTGKVDAELITYMDYIKMYEEPAALGAQVINTNETELDEVYVDFNSTVSNINEGVLSINGKLPASIALEDEENQIYKLTFAEKLKPMTEYKLSLNGVSNTIGQTAYNEVAFTTGALKGNEIYYDISGAGIVKSEDEEIKNGSFSEKGSHNLTVKPNKGYEAVVKVNGEEIAAGAYATYDITVTDGAYVEISFVAVDEEAAPSFVSVPYIFTEGNTSYTFARINKSIGNKNYGVIASADKTEPTIEDVNGETTFKFPAVRGTNRYGEFGIGIKDNAEGKLGNKYYVRAYAVSEGVYYYGETTEVNIAK